MEVLRSKEIRCSRKVCCARSRLQKNTDSVAVLVDAFTSELSDRTQNKSSTIRKKGGLLRMAKQNIGHLSILDIDTVELQAIFDSMTPSAYQNHRKAWTQFGKWLVAKGWWEKNFAEATLAIVVKRNRERHTDIGYQQIYNASPDWMQIAMELAVSSLQDLTVLCNLTNDNFENGRLLLTREKTGANLAIVIKPSSRLDKAISRSRSQSTIGEHLIRRVPKRRRPGPGWSRVNGDTLSKAFRTIRDECGAYNHLEPEKRPDWRSLRSYGAHLYREAGYPEQYIQALLAHTDIKLTVYYADDGYATRYTDVEAGL